MGIDLTTGITSSFQHVDAAIWKNSPTVIDPTEFPDIARQYRAYYTQEGLEIRADKTGRFSLMGGEGLCVLENLIIEMGDQSDAMWAYLFMIKEAILPTIENLFRVGGAVTSKGQLIPLGAIRIEQDQELLQELAQNGYYRRLFRYFPDVLTIDPGLWGIAENSIILVVCETHPFQILQTKRGGMMFTSVDHNGIEAAGTLECALLKYINRMLESVPYTGIRPHIKTIFRQMIANIDSVPYVYA